MQKIGFSKAKPKKEGIGMKKKLKRAFFATVPVLTGYLVLGMGFGVMMQNKGYGILWSLGFSVFVYAGSMQYLSVNLLSGGATLLAAALATLMVNGRHLFYGISMVDRYRDAGKEKPYLIFALTDETYSLLCTGKNSDIRFLISLLDQIYWVAGSALGSLVGALLPFELMGIDFALTALFLCVFVEQWMSTKDHIPAIAGVVCSVLCLLLFGRENFLIPAMISITAVLTALKWFRKGAKA